MTNLKSRAVKYAFSHWGVPAKLREEISKVYIKRFLPKNPVIIDCGANDGWDTIQLAETMNGVVYAFEPVPELYNRLCKRTSAYASVKCFPVALSDKNGTAEFYVSEGASDASSSILPPKQHLDDHPAVLFNKKIQVETMTLDSWAEKNGVNRIDLLWLDMQGSEFQMLMASPKILETVTAIYTEVNLVENYAGGKLYPEYKQWLQSKGFSVKLEAIPDAWHQGNVLFIRKS